MHLHSTQKGKFHNVHEAKILYGTYCTCFRCESYNSVIRSRNVYSNRQAPSKDIATAFATQESIRFTFSGSCYNTSEGLIFLETWLIVNLNFLLAYVLRTFTKEVQPF